MEKYELLSVSESVVEILHSSGKRSTFSINCARPFYEDATACYTKKTDKCFLTDERETFRASRMEEINGLQEIGSFEIVDALEANNCRLYNYVFTEKIKDDGSKQSRLSELIRTKHMVSSPPHRQSSEFQSAYTNL